MATIFDSVKERFVPSSRFNLSHEVKTTFNMAQLVPVLCQEVLPGDRWQLQSEMMIQFQPMLAPIMQRVNAYVHYFFVPTRLLFSDYEKFFDPKQTASVSMPKLIIPMGFLNEPLAITDYTDGSASQKRRLHNILQFLDYMGLPVIYEVGNADMNPELEVSLLPFYAYALIYNEYYRDQNLEADLLDTFQHGLESGTNIAIEDCITAPFPGVSDSFDEKNWLGLRIRAWEKDYFTSALPDPQVGQEVHLPLQGQAPVVFSGNGTLLETYDVPDLTNRVEWQSNNDETGKHGYISISNDGEFNFNPVKVAAGQAYADMSNVTATTINELRRASRLQEFLERTARAGRRYKEMIASHFGVFSKDGRLDRPEFLGGGVQSVKVSQVLSHTGQADGQDFVLGQLGGHAESVGAVGRTRRRFTEHGYIFAIVSVMPRTAYMDGLPRMFSKLDMYDFYWPEFARIGEQEILNKEVSVWEQDDDTKDGTFGYAPRYSEYKFIPSSVHGELRSSLDYWHLARKLDKNAAVLNEKFMHPDPQDLSRIFAVETGSDQLICWIYNRCIAIRKMPKYGIPTL